MTVRAGIDVVVVETLRDQHEIGNAEVDGDRNNGRDKICPDSAWMVLKPRARDWASV